MISRKLYQFLALLIIIIKSQELSRDASKFSDGSGHHHRPHHHNYHHHRPHHHHNPHNPHDQNRSQFWRWKFYRDESQNRGGNGVCYKDKHCDRLRLCNLSTKLCEGLPMRRRQLKIMFRQCPNKMRVVEPRLCSSDCDCSGFRVCSKYKICQGTYKYHQRIFHKILQLP